MSANPDDISPPLDWSVRVEDIPARGLAWSKTALADECQRIAAALGVIEVARLVASGRIEAVPGGSYRLTGRLSADVVQACVVTLEPVASTMDEPIAVEFRPADDVADDLAATPDYSDAVEVEPIERGALAAGRVVYETLSAALDPYPRAVGAGVPIDVIAKPKGAGEAHPFAALARLKDKGGKTENDS